MAEDNPWKRQQNINKQNNSPISNFPPQQQTTPPWMKKKEEDNSPVQTNRPAWQKPPPATNNNADSTPPWKKAQQSSPQQSWMKKAETASSSQPAWKQQNQSGGGNMWKNPADQKKKKQEEEKAKREEQERLRVQREKQESNQKRERDWMTVEDALSKDRQAHDKEAEKKKLEEELKSKKTNSKKLKKNSNINNQGVKRELQSDGLLEKYFFYYEQSSNKLMDYKDKIEAQTELLKIIKNEFSKKVQQAVIGIMEDSQLKSKNVNTIKKNRLFDLKFDDGGLQWSVQIYYALCEGRGKTIQESAPQNIEFDYAPLQQLQNVFQFYEDLTNSIFLIAKKLPQIKLRTPLMTLIKYRGVTFLGEGLCKELLSSTLSSVGEFKQIQNEVTLIEKQLKDVFGYNINRNDLYVKRIAIGEEDSYVLYLKNWDIGPKRTQIKSEQILEKIHDNYFLSKMEIPKLVTQKQFSRFLKVKTAPYRDLTQALRFVQAVYIVYCSCQGEVQEESFWSLVLEQSEDIWKMINCAGYKNPIIKRHIIFHLFEIFTGVKFRIKKSTFQKRKVITKRTYAKTYVYSLESSEVIELTKNYEKYLKESKLPLALKSFEAYQSLSAPNDSSQVQNDSQSQVSRSKQEQGDEQSSQHSSPSKTNRAKKKDEPTTFDLDLVIKKGCLLLSQSLFEPAISLYKETIDSLGKLDFVQIALKMELLCIYIKLKKEKESLKTFQELLELIDLYYMSQKTLINCSLYQMLGTFYASISAQLAQPDTEGSSLAVANSQKEHSLKFFELAIDIVIQYHGDQSHDLADALLSRAISSISLKDFQMSLKDIETAMKIYKASSKYNNKIAECYFCKGQIKLILKEKEDGVENIEHSASIYSKISKFAECIEVQLVAIQALKSNEDAWSVSKIQELTSNIVETCLIQKNVTNLSKAITTLLQLLDEDIAKKVSQIAVEGKKTEQEEEEDSTHEESDLFFAIDELEQFLKGFSSFYNMVKWLSSHHSETVKEYDAIQTKTGSALSLLAKFYKPEPIGSGVADQSESSSREIDQNSGMEGNSSRVASQDANSVAQDRNENQMQEQEKQIQVDNQ